MGIRRKELLKQVTKRNEIELKRVNWIFISGNKLSEEFIREFQDKVDWVRISKSQKLSESFICEFKDKVDWMYISGYQTLSDDFLNKYKKNIDWEFYFYQNAANYLILKRFISKTTYRHIVQFNTELLSESQKKDIKKILSIKNMFVR
jgi:hypothetical protein